MIIVTGAAGFIGSVMAGYLNQLGFKDLVLSDDFTRPDKQRNFTSKAYTALVPREELPEWIDRNEKQIEFILHLGARTDTAEKDVELFNRLNLNYSKAIWQRCVQYQIPLVYASSAATYGRGDQGFSDSHEVIPTLKPQNPYAQSKQDFDLWVLDQKETPFFWAGLKFFNVYGPNEYHKGRMASVIFHAYNQIKETGQVKLFRSHRPDYADGGQLRDFIYVLDLCQIMHFLMTTRKHSGIYNTGTGKARSFADLANGVFDAMGVPREILFVDMPLDIRDGYQYYTQAEMGKLRGIGYDKPFHSLEEGIADYVRNYLQAGKVY